MEVGQEVFAPWEENHPLSYGAWVGSSDRVLQSISGPTTCFIKNLRTREELWFIQSHTMNLGQNVYLFKAPRPLERYSLCKVLLGFPPFFRSQVIQ